MNNIERGRIMARVDALTTERDRLIGELNQDIARGAGIGDVRHCLNRPPESTRALAIGLGVILAALAAIVVGIKVVSVIDL